MCVYVHACECVCMSYPVILSHHCTNVGDNVDSFFQRVACVAFERVARESDRSKREETVALGSALIGM